MTEKQLYCPKCGSTNTQPNPTPNGGYLYVAEETGGSTEFFDDAQPHKCNNCDCNFYLGQ
jgi:hypothetical protein